MANTKRYYKVGETVFVKENRDFGVIKGLNINPSEEIYKATIEVNGEKKEVYLWEIDKDKRKNRKDRKIVDRGLNKGYFDVRAFQTAFSHPVADYPTFMPKDRLDIRMSFIQEELQELLDAETVVDQADAIIDALYFLFGNLVEMGVRPDKLWDIVQEANMAKLFPDGKPRYREGDGKVIKPDGWEKPEPKLAEEIQRQIDLQNK